MTSYRKRMKVRKQLQESRQEGAKVAGFNASTTKMLQMYATCVPMYPHPPLVLSYIALSRLTPS
eukprot:1317390-Amorphochlora_amoeboformis.AAC.2